MRIIKTYAVAGGVAIALAFVLSATRVDRALAEVVSHVIVDNTAGQAVPIRDVSGRAPYTVSLGAGFGSYTLTNKPFTVPQGRRLVLESVSVRTEVPVGQKVFAYIKTLSTPDLGAHWLMFTPQGTFFGHDELVATQSLHVYANQGTNYVYVGRNSSNGTGTWTATLVGYLIPAP
jgi:hypothetical protein